MIYFTSEFITFFRELSANNSKQWFDANRDRYEKFVKKPFEDFIADLVIAVQSFDPSIQINPKKAIFRINRDIRFSNDKTPYKENRSAVLSRQSRKEEFPAYYLRIDPENIHIGGGLFSLSKENLFKVRQEIMYNEKEFMQATEEPAFKKNFGEIKGGKNKLLKAPFKEVAAETPVLYNKQFYYMASFSSEILLKEDLIPFIVDKLSTAYPVNKFLQLSIEEA